MENHDFEIEIELTNLGKLLASEKELLDLAKSGIVLDPLIIKDEKPVVIKGTINAIVGHEGSHKSRLAESIASMLLSEKSTSNSLGLDRYDNEDYRVLYVDTERNAKSELPLAVKRVLDNVASSNGSTFHPFSLKNTPRVERLHSLKMMLSEKRIEFGDKHMVIFLDVITDCVMNFNDVEQSLDLLDHLGEMAENFNATFFVVIHKNPAHGGKARGHLGTELENKANSSFHISQKDGVIGLNFKKTRNSKQRKDMLLKYDEHSGGLIKLSGTEEGRVLQSKQRATEDLKKFLMEIMPAADTAYEQKFILNSLKDKFNISGNTGKKRMQELSDENSAFEDGTVIEIAHSAGKTTVYKRVQHVVEDTSNAKTSN